MPETESVLITEGKKKECASKSQELIHYISVNCYSLPVSSQMTIYKAITGLINCHYYSRVSMQLPKCLSALYLGGSLFN